MPDGVIKIGTQVDVSGLKSGMAEAENTVKATTASMEGAYRGLAQATLDYAAKQNVLRDAIKQTMTGALPYSESIKVLTPILQENTDASNLLREAKARLAAVQKEATEAVAANTMAQTLSTQVTEEAAAATGSLTGRFYAAQGASALLAGRVPVRAFERFLSVIPMVNEALAVAFPVIGAIALVEIVGEGIAKIEKLKQAANEAADNIAAAWRNMTAETLSANASLLTQTDRLRVEMDKLLKVPQHSEMAVMFDQAAEAADRLSGSIDRDLDKMQRLVDLNNKKTSIGFWGSFWSDKAETGDTDKLIHDQISKIQKVEADNEDVIQRATASGDKGNLQHAQEWRLVALQQAYKSATDTITAQLKTLSREQEDYEASGKTMGKDQTANINALVGALKELQAEQENIGTSYRNENLEQKVTPLKDAEAAAKPQQHLEAQTRGAYLSGVFDDMRKQNQKLAADTKATQAEISQAFKVEADDAERSLRQEVRAQQEAAAAYRDRARILDETTRAALEQSSAAKSVREAEIAAAEQSHAMTRLAADQARAAAEAEFYAQQLEKLRSELAQLTPETDAYRRVQAQIAQTQAQQKISGIGNAAKIQRDVAQPYLTAFGQINDGWLRVQNQMMYSTRNISMEFAKMGQSLAISAIDGLEKMALKAIETDLITTLSKRNAVATQTAITQQGAAQSQAISAESSLKEISGSAASAAAKAWSALAGIPVVGPVLGAAAAASTFAGVMAFQSMASLDTGTGYVPRDGLAAIHQGEIVVPAPTADELRNGGGGGGGDIHVHQVNNWNPHSDQEFRRALERNASHVAYAVRKHIRQAGH